MKRYLLSLTLLLPLIGWTATPEAAEVRAEEIVIDVYKSPG